MNAVIKPEARKASAKAAARASAPVDEARRLFAELGALLYMAAETDEVPDGSGYSDRLLRIAANLAEEAGEENWIGRTFEEEGAHPWVDHKAFDIAALVAALVAAAMHTPGDPCSDDRCALLLKIKPLLVKLTGSEECLNPELQGASAQDTAGSSREELRERLELAMDAAIEIKAWMNLIGPVAKEAIFDAGLRPDQPDWHAIASTVFARIGTLLSAIYYVQDSNEFPTAQFRQCVEEGKSVEETHWEADLKDRLPPRMEAAHA